MTHGSDRLVKAAYDLKTALPAFNIPYLPMMEPTVRALRDSECAGLITVSYLELHKFEARSLEAVRDEYERVKDERYTRLHLDHAPVIDEDGVHVEYRALIENALALGYDSVMIDGSRLSLDDNILRTREIVDLARARGVPVEAELGAVAGHEEGPLPPYEELFKSKAGFTDPAQAKRFVAETGVDWLSVSVGSIHGAITKARKDEMKVAARLDTERLRAIDASLGIPLVLHGGTGIPREYVHAGIAGGIAKINVATATRQPYERALSLGVGRAQEQVYEAARRVIAEDLGVQGSALTLRDALSGG